MNYLNETDLLDQMILTLKIKKSDEFDSLKEQFQITYESIKPLNLIKNAFIDCTEAPALKNNLLNTLISLSTGYLSKKIIVGKTHNPIKRILGSLFQIVITTAISKRANI